MGWADGSDLFNEVWCVVREYVSEDKRVHVCARMIEAFEGRDWDTQNESERDEWPEVSLALRALHPRWYKDGAP